MLLDYLNFWFLIEKIFTNLYRVYLLRLCFKRKETNNYCNKVLCEINNDYLIWNVGNINVIKIRSWKMQIYKVDAFIIRREIREKNEWMCVYSFTATFLLLTSIYYTIILISCFIILICFCISNRCTGKHKNLVLNFVTTLNYIV